MFEIIVILGFLILLATFSAVYYLLAHGEIEPLQMIIMLWVAFGLMLFIVQKIDDHKEIKQPKKEINIKLEI